MLEEILQEGVSNILFHMSYINIHYCDNFIVTTVHTKKGICGDLHEMVLNSVPNASRKFKFELLSSLVLLGIRNFPKHLTQNCALLSF